MAELPESGLPPDEITIGSEAGPNPAPNASPTFSADVDAHAPDPEPLPWEQEVDSTALPSAPAAVEMTDSPTSDASTTVDAVPADLPTRTFASLPLPESVRKALESIGWDTPMVVQDRVFDDLCAGRDLLVQSQTGSGKTGAFCIPWLAARFEHAPPLDTGIQLIVLTPTRELAKQVHDELVRLGSGLGVRALTIYGGTAMQPQFTALREGVHAVVGTPGRILDHLRRRSLDLSRIRTVVLDEADEMLSMGFLEDIRSILEACPRERQTCLFSATIPPDIERISKRYMNDHAVIRVSGDDVAAAEIQHGYYTVSGAIKTRDLLDVIAVEEPASAIVFCNTREETNFVASVLRREGFHAEALSSDLSQAARERVMRAMREGRLRFLVATDIAARGIDISHVSHVINYSFPENAEAYVHRTGRTGRAGRRGIALSLIGPHDVGNLYSLKRQYPSIQFDERPLPPPEELARQRTETKLDQLSRQFPELVGPEWTLLARSLVADPRGERIVAYLLERGVTERTIEPRRIVDELDHGALQAGEEIAAPRPSLERDDESERSGRRRRGGGRERGRPFEEERRITAPPAERQPETILPFRAPPSVDRDPVSTPGHAAPVVEDSVELSVAGDPVEGEAKSGRRRRRRRKRRSGAPGTDLELAGQAATTLSEDDDAAVAMSRPASRPADLPTEDGVSHAGTAGGRKRKRRRRGGRSRTGEPAAAEPLPRVAQDQIIIEIDEEELGVVLEEYGEIDELDELTLKARRRAVIESLEEEMEIEDLTAVESAAAAQPQSAHVVGAGATETSAGDESDEDDGGDDAAEGADAVGDAGSDPNKRKRRRRRRKRKKVEEVVTPELMVPPHKDFWEAWAAKFNYRDFEDEVFYPKNGMAEPVEVVEPIVEFREPEMSMAVVEGDFTWMRLNVGRQQQKKASHIRELLRDKTSLSGRAVRDLTVREASTVFRVPVASVPLVQQRLAGLEIDGVRLEPVCVESSADDDANAAGSEAGLPSVPRFASSAAAATERDDTAAPEDGDTFARPQ